jgi:WD40 repeat protein
VANHAPRRRTVFKGDAPGIETIAFSPDGRMLAAGQRNGHIRLWTLGRLWSSNTAVLTGHSGAITSLAFATDGRSLATGGQDQTVRLWDLTAKPRANALLNGATHTIRQVSFASEGTVVTGVSASWEVFTWDAATGTRLHEWSIPHDLICSMAMTWDGRYLAAGLTSGRIHIYRVGARRTH